MLKFSVASVDSVIVYFGETICESTAKKVRNGFYLLNNENLEHVLEIVPSYTSIMITYDFLEIKYEKICEKIKLALKDKGKLPKELEGKSVEIPVYYSQESGLDLADLADSKSLTIQEIISLHVQKEYFVYAIGFSPGFPYMGEVNELLATPRLANPRAKVPKGSVGIADKQTAIYPQLSPGGWQILGRTPIEMFDTSYDGFSYLKVGDKVQFCPIKKGEFLKLGGQL